eukprot:TRINITY_DN328_c0_g1_i1.p1 TRINITY_DN328_c0_g1~~TRINITY_DN328_c0_g1_i1.p1  ORF type:complete len:553 (-),score=90.91 TRINITY_DN328_c0_g1_i1:36-1694(-)
MRLNYLLVFLCCVGVAFSLPIWKIFCSSNLIYRGRIDPIVNPGAISGHSHRVYGGQNFGPGSTTINATQQYNYLTRSQCTSCSNSKDLSNYWIPDLYYQYPTGTFQLVPNAGLTVYYLSRGGTGNQSQPVMTAFPEGLRMLAGSPYRRSFTNGSVADKAISYNCLTSQKPGPQGEPNNFPTDRWVCDNGLRAQIWFPMCWDGVNLDSADHKSHMSYPIQAPDGGDCPATHPVRIPGIFFEILFDVNPSKWPHGQGTNPFVWSCGDPTGYGLHGDFLNGWDRSVVAAALLDPQCDLSKNPNLNFGNNVKACPPLAPYVITGSDNCQAPLVPGLVEDLGLGHAISALPGCNPINAGPQASSACAWGTTQPSVAPGTYRGYMKNNATGLYLEVDPANKTVSLVAGPAQWATQAWVFAPYSNGSQWISEGTEGYVGTTPSGAGLLPNRPYVSGWETWYVYPSNVNGMYLIQAQATGAFLSVTGTGAISVKGNETSANSLWVFETPVVLPVGTKFQPDVSGSQYGSNSDLGNNNSQELGNKNGAATMAKSWLAVFGF